MSSSITVSDDSAEPERLNALVPLSRSRTLVVSMGTCSSASDVSAAAGALVRRLRVDAAEGIFARTRTVVVLVLPESANRAYRGAAIQALRGIVQSVTREFAHRSQAMNLLVVSEANLDAAETSLRYLDDPDGGYTAGFTFDMTLTEAAA